MTWAGVLLVLFGAFFFTLTRLASAHASLPTRATQFSPISDMGGVVIGPRPDVRAVGVYLFDADTGASFYEKNADVPRPMASTTKVMTALLAVEHGSLDQTVLVGADAAALVRPDSSKMGLSAGEQLTLRDLLYGLMLPSGNDAAVAIADAIGGSEAHFVEMMNARARELGLTHTHYANPHGLDDDDHYTSAHDLAVLAAAALRQEELVKIAGTLHYSIPQTDLHKGYELQTGDDLLAGARSPYPGALGLKPGYTGPAGYTMAFAARRHGHLIVGAVLGDPSWQVRIDDMRALLDWGFAQEGVAPASAATPGAYPDPNE